MTQTIDTTEAVINTTIENTTEVNNTDTANTSSEKKKKDFAAMNGVNSIKPQEPIAQSKQEEVEPELFTTTRPISQNPLIKMAVVGGGILLFIALIGSVINGSISALNQATTKTGEPTKTEDVSQESQAVDETGQTKTALALTSQQEKFEKLRNQKAQEQEAVSSPKPLVVPPPQPRVIPQRQPIARSISPQPKLVAPPRIPQPQPKPVAVSRPIKQASVSRIQSQPVDPAQQWQAAAQIGSFSSSSVEDELPDVNGIKGGTGQSVKTSDQDVMESGNNQEVDYDAKRVLVGSKTEGKLETPIAWSPQNSSNVAQNYLIKISKPLKAADNSEVLPLGSYLVAQLSNSNSSGFVHLHGVAVLINKDGETQQKQLPENSVLILSKEGSFLKAQSRNGSNVGNSLMSAVIAGVAKAAEIQNRPTAQITTTSSGISTSSTTNGERDLLSGFGEGAFGNVLRDIQASNQRQASEFSSQDKVFVIDAGKTVQIFINQAISL
ncbi:hypothetical protein [aff. Roholtiella sp. LEGE 12411]|uniref:hypothetical protein n=1 Tax=aff. Roholtiella sp. LEGE 12411 TaxID=1828822 RepID=UPI001882B93B|nr:hypothetical protein [aff. Roholtiella sp. LEGE 12411]MBE9038234.1 hypothetical protein [aff. Roholtiella sp. LEGE 12411]